MSGPPSAAAAQTSLPDPHQDRAVAGGDAPSRTGRLLNLVRKLIDYGKELAGTLQQRASATNRTEVTWHFGTIDIAAILACITRGLHRAVALEARLSSRAACREDGPAPTSVLAQRKPRTVQLATRRANDADPRLACLSTPDAIAAKVRRRPVGAVIADICRDLGILLSHPLWRELSDAIIEYGGSLACLLKDTGKRVFSFMVDPPAVAPPAWPAPCPQLAPASGAGPP
ncbi:MAG TPA: hypothetical protein VND19_21160 [Acetobacteraceae bacterium]|nr:hypothetical protein [Acetobacteraceae bacterium]